MGNWIREGRDRLGITQEQLAAKIGVNRTTLARMENGWKVSDQLHDRIREAFSEDGRVWIAGGWIREGRTALGLTQKQLAEKIGCNQTNISTAERGQGCSKPLEMKLKAVFGIDQTVEEIPVEAPQEGNKGGLQSRLESMAGKYGRACRDIHEKDKKIQELEDQNAKLTIQIQKLEDRNETLDLNWRDATAALEDLKRGSKPIEQFRSVQAYEGSTREIHLTAIVDELRRANAELFERVTQLQTENAVLKYKAGADL